LAKILIVSNDIVAKHMAGPAIRAWEFAHLLSHHGHDVTLATPGVDNLNVSQFALVTYRDNKELKKLTNSVELILTQGAAVVIYPSLIRKDRIIIVDFYDPFLIEVIYKCRRADAKRVLWENHKFHLYLSAINIQSRIGDFFMCANEAQRYYWLGHLSSLGRLNPILYNDNQNLKHLIDIVPFGLSANPPLHTKQVLKGVFPGIGAEDKVILWGGGIYEWFDPLTLVRAMKEVVIVEPRAKLLFLGVRHPNPDVEISQVAQRAMDLAKELGLLNQAIFFYPEWVPYQERHNYLLEADIGVTTHFTSIETELSYRTRILDYIWANLPIVTTQGDSLAELIRTHNLGKVVDFENVPQLTEALLQLLNSSRFKLSSRQNFLQVAQLMTWAEVSKPLLNFCANPQKAPDTKFMNTPAIIKAIRGEYRHPQSYLGKAWINFKLRGIQILLKEANKALQRRLLRSI
jgi:glycosyltransferase involved in cell wall biosynthesis